MLSSQEKLWIIIITILICSAVFLLLEWVKGLGTSDVPDWQQLSDYRVSVYEVWDEN